MGIKSFIISLNGYCNKFLFQYSIRGHNQDTYSDLKVFFERSLETAEIIECVAS